MAKKYKIGYTAGVFDLFHVGHLNLLEKSKEMCDKLIVGICNDDYVRNIKKKEPVFLENDRARIVQALKCVDEVYLIDPDLTIDKVEAQRRFQFDVLFSGDDWRGSERYNETEKKMQDIGVDVQYFPYTKEISTTKIKEKMAKG